MSRCQSSLYFILLVGNDRKNGIKVNIVRLASGQTAIMEHWVPLGLFQCRPLTATPAYKSEQLVATEHAAVPPRTGAILSGLYVTF